MSKKEQTSFDHARFLRQTFRLQREASKEFHYVLRRAKGAAADGQVDLAVRWCIHGATLAGLSNPGFFYSHEMEQLLSDIGRSRLTSADKALHVSGEFKRFLHVLTVAYESGGHTRAVSRWIDTCTRHAPGEQHSILLSTQNESPIPAWLTESVQKSGGEIIDLAMGLSLREKAAQMRFRSTEFDAIILHIHPNDPLPNIAFCDTSVPVLFFNHADHMFSLGTDVAKVIADVRPIGHDLSIRFRSPAARKIIVPLPLVTSGAASCAKAEARKKLGLPADALIALTVGEPYKFSPMYGYSFPALIQSLCAANPRVIIAAVGLSASAPFPELKRMTGGRFLPVGLIKDSDILDLYYCAADIYLDSYPCTSLTSVLDAALRGLPVQRFRNPYQPLMWCDDPGIDSVSCPATTQEEYVQGALEWLAIPDDKRSELGDQFRTAVSREHCGESWKCKWLDPAIQALNLPCDDEQHRARSEPPTGEFSYGGFGRAYWATDWPASMFVAEAILSTEHLPRSIRISGLLHSIKPLLLDTAGDGMLRKRVWMFARLLEPFLRRRILAAPRKLRSAISRS